MTIRYYLICTFLCATCTIKAQEALFNRAADSLYRQQQYADAAIMYERMLFSTTDPLLVYHAVNGKIQCLKQQRHFTQAVRFVKMNLTGQLPDTVRQQLLHEQLLCNFLAGSYEDALAVADQFNILFPAHHDKRLLLIQLLSLNELAQWKEAATVYAAYMQGMPAAGYPNPYDHLPRLKNKDKAQWLSTFIPGGGQWYAGRRLEALASVILQGAGLYFGITSFVQHYYLSAWLVGAGLAGSFHAGSVRRAEILVDQYNKKQAGRFNARIKNQLIKAE